jgi:pimeloyl-ACP methyl ester carboxylesterase
MYGDRDNIVDPGQSQLLGQRMPRAVVQRFPNCGHFIMLDEPQAFMQRLKSFLNESTIH